MIAIFRTRCGCQQTISIPDALPFMNLELDRDARARVTLDPTPIHCEQRTFRLMGITEYFHERTAHYLEQA